MIALFLILMTSCAVPNKTSIKVRNNASGTATDIKITNGDGGTVNAKVTPSAEMSISLDSLRVGKR